MTDIAVLRALLGKATNRGKWRSILPGDLDWLERRKYRCIEFDRKSWYDTGPLQPQDARLIVIAIDALPDLLTELERLRGLQAQVSEITSQHGLWRQHHLDFRHRNEEPCNWCAALAGGAS